MLSLPFAPFVDEEATVNRPVEERNPRTIIEVDEMCQLRVAGDESARIATALLIHERADALVDGREFLRIAETNAVFWIEEDAALLLRYGRFGEVAGLERDVGRDTGGNRIRVRVLDRLRRDVRRDDLRQTVRAFLRLRVEDHLLPDLFRRRAHALARRDKRRRLAGDDARVALDGLEGEVSLERTGRLVHSQHDGFDGGRAAAAHRREKRRRALPPKRHHARGSQRLLHGSRTRNLAIASL